jgi:preprotein translocase subunit YajC
MNALMTSLALAATTTEPSPGSIKEVAEKNPQMMLIFLVGFIFLMYWMLLGKPQQQQKAKRENMLNSLQRDDHVVTIGGIHGRVSHVDGEKKTVSVKVSKAIELEFSLSAISTVTRDKGGAKDQ